MTCRSFRFINTLIGVLLTLAMSIPTPAADGLASGGAAVAPPPARVPLASAANYSESSLHVRVAAEDAQRFYTVLEAFVRKEKVAIVAEGVPLHPLGGQKPLDLLTLTPMPSLLTNLTPEETEKAMQSPVALRLSDMGHSYDYDLSRVGSVFVLRKCYSDPSDLPDVSVAEAVAFLHRALLLFKDLDPKGIGDGGDLSAFAVQFVRGLNKEQLAHLEQFRLSLVDLDVNQQEEAKRFTRFFHVHVPHNDISVASKLLQECVKSDRYLSWSTTYQKGQRLLGVVSPTGWRGSDTFISLSDDKLWATSPPPDSPQSAKVITARLAAIQSPVELRGVTSLKALTDEQKRRSNGTLVVALDDAIADKRVCVYGAEFASPEALVRASAAVYNLRLVKRKDGTHSLMPPPVPAVEMIGDLHEAMTAILPECYRRAFHLDAANARALLHYQAMDQETEETFDYFDYTNAIAQREKLMRYEGTRRILYTEGKRAPDEHPLVCKLSEDEKNDITAILLADALDSFRMITRPYQEPYLSDWSLLTLGGGISTDEKGKTLYHLFLSQPTRGQPGKMHTTNGLVAPGD